eukprot:tig00001128_g7175.t1
MLRAAGCSALEELAVKLQSLARASLARKRASETLQAASVLQSAVRVLLARSARREQRQRRRAQQAAVLLQSLMRQRLAEQVLIRSKYWLKDRYWRDGA